MTTQSQMTIDSFIRWEVRSRDSIDVKRCYVDAAGELVAGVLLSQIIFWHLPDEQGNSKLRVVHEGYQWIAKKREDWWDEVRISAKQFDRCVSALEEKGLIVTKLFRFQGSPTKHIRLKWDALLQSLEDLPNMVFPKKSKSNLPSENDTAHTEENGYSPKVNIDIPQRSISNLPKGENVYIDPERTTENTNREETPSTPSCEIVKVEEREKLSEGILTVVTEEEFLSSSQLVPKEVQACIELYEQQGAITKHQLKIWANWQLRELVKVYRKSGQVLSPQPNDISREFLNFLVMQHKDQTLHGAARWVQACENDPSRWQELSLLAATWKAEEVTGKTLKDYQSKKKDNELRQAYDYTQINFFGNV